MKKLTIKQANLALKKHGTEAALRILTQAGYLRWAKGKPIRARDIRKDPRLD